MYNLLGIVYYSLQTVSWTAPCGRIIIPPMHPAGGSPFDKIRHEKFRKIFTVSYHVLTMRVLSLTGILNGTFVFRRHLIDEPIKIFELMSTVLKRFNEKYVVNSRTGCWDWIASRSHSGTQYGMLYNEVGVVEGAHRISYRLFNGNIPEGLYVMHTCDNKHCVNPEHLVLGTHSDNLRDFHEKNPEAFCKINKISELFEKYRDIHKAAEELNIKSSTVRNTLYKDKKFRKAVLSKERGSTDYNLDILPKEMKKTFLFWLSGYHYEDIADKLNIPIGTVRSRVHRAKKLSLQEK